MPSEAAAQQAGRRSARTRLTTTSRLGRLRLDRPGFPSKRDADTPSRGPHRTAPHPRTARTPRWPTPRHPQSNIYSRDRSCPRKPLTRPWMMLRPWPRQVAILYQANFHPYLQTTKTITIKAKSPTIKAKSPSALSTGGSPPSVDTYGDDTTEWAGCDAKRNSRIRGNRPCDRRATESLK